MQYLHTAGSGRKWELGIMLLKEAPLKFDKPASVSAIQYSF